MALYSFQLKGSHWPRNKIGACALCCNVILSITGTALWQKFQLGCSSGPRFPLTGSLKGDIDIDIDIGIDI